MSAKAKEPKEAFFDHSINFFKKRAQKPDAATKARIASSADPYRHLDSPRARQAEQPKNYSQNPAEAQVEEDVVPQEAPRAVESSDPLLEVYRVIREHSGVRFGAQRSDGSWEVSPPGAPAQQITLEKSGSSQRKKGKGSAQTTSGDRLDPAVQSFLADELKKLLR